MNTARTCIDANVLLEIVLGRKKEHAARQVLAATGSKPIISALSAHLVIHFGRERAALAALQQFLDDYEILPLDWADFNWAFQNRRNDDFEDALQLAVAVRHGCQEFVTFDRPLAKAYGKLPQLSVKLLG